MLQEQRDALLDETVDSQEARYENAASIINDYFDMQSEGYQAIMAEAQASMVAEGEVGVAAAALVAAEIELILAKLASSRTRLLASIGSTDYGTGTKPKGGSGGGKSVAERMKAMFETANREAEVLKERFFDPFAYELPKSIEAARNKIAKLADKSGGKWTQDMKDLFDLMSSNIMSKEMLKMADATRDINRGLMGERGRRNDIYKEEVSRLRTMKAKLIEMGIWRVEWEKYIQDQLLALQQQHATASPMGEFLGEWKSVYDDIEQAGTDAIRSLSQGMADMVTEGKADFEDLARSAVNSLLQIGFNAALSGVGSLIQSGITGAFPGLGSGTPLFNIGGGASSGSASIITAGPTGQSAPSILADRAGSAQNVAGVAGGSGSNQQAKVNIINNSGTQLESETTNARFSPDGLVLDVVLKEINRPGPFRDSMKRAMK